jgi:hypothetical protein
MGLLGKLFKRKISPCLEDPAFGHIEYERGLWSFVPQTRGEGFMISIEAPLSGPSELQRLFFQSVRDELGLWKERARAFIKTQEGVEIDPQSLDVYAGIIENDLQTPGGVFTLEMSDANAFEIHRVTFRGAEAVEYGCDD